MKRFRSIQLRIGSSGWFRLRSDQGNSYGQCNQGVALPNREGVEVSEVSSISEVICRSRLLVKMILRSCASRVLILLHCVKAGTSFCAN